MENIHTATVPSASSSAARNDDKEPTLIELIAEKTRVEEELSALSSVLDSVSILYFVPFHI